MACPNTDWRTIVALCRYGGLRCPSEVLTLKWADVDWEHGRFRVHSPKTEHHPGKEVREVPLFPELREFSKKHARRRKSAQSMLSAITCIVWPLTRRLGGRTAICGRNSAGF